MGKNISSLITNNRLVPLTIGVTILSLLVVFAISAWTGPPDVPPPAGICPSGSPGCDSPIHVGSDAQTKTGNLTVNNLTTAGGNLYLNDSGEGNIWRANWIVGDGDLFLKSNAAENATVYIAGSDISFWSGGSEKWNIDSSGSLVKGSVPWGRVVDFTEEDCPLDMAVVGRNLDGSFKCAALTSIGCDSLGCAIDDGLGGCIPKAAGEQSLPACQRCDGVSLTPVYYADNSADSDGINTCDAAADTCMKCNGLGSCVPQGAVQDLWSQCSSGSGSSDGCATGNCSGSGYSCGVISSGNGACSSCQTCNDGDVACDNLTGVWGAGLYGCSGGSTDDPNRCYQGDCINCGGWGNAGYCWYNAGVLNIDCDNVCSTHGGTYYGSCNWTNDPMDCSTCRHWYPGSGCGYLSEGPGWMPGGPSGNCKYHWQDFNRCWAEYSNLIRQCACNR